MMPTGPAAARYPVPQVCGNGMPSGSASPLGIHELHHIYREPLWCYSATSIALADRIIVEVGPGRGDFLFHLAQQNPRALVCGIELMHERFEKLMRRRDRQQLENIWLIQGDARRVLPEIFAEGVHDIHIHFSDPWPKRKHFKNRLMQKPFIAACAKALLPGGYLYFTTDWPEYSEWTEKLLAQATDLHSEYTPAVQLSRTDVFPSYFYQKWIAQGRQIHCQKYYKK